MATQKWLKQFVFVFVHVMMAMVHSRKENILFVLFGLEHVVEINVNVTDTDGQRKCYSVYGHWRMSLATRCHGKDEIDDCIMQYCPVYNCSDNYLSTFTSLTILITATATKKLFDCLCNNVLQDNWS